MFRSGIAIMVGSTVSILLAITWRGIQFPWSSAHVLVPLIVGAVGQYGRRIPYTMPAVEAVRDALLDGTIQPDDVLGVIRDTYVFVSL